MLEESSGPYVVESSVVIKPSASLILSPGTTLLFLTPGRIVVQGTFQAIGTKKKPVRFLPASSEEGCGSIYVQAGARFEGHHIQASSVGKSAEAFIEQEGGSVSISSALFENIKGFVLRTKAGSLELSDVEISNAQRGILLENGQAKLYCLRVHKIAQGACVYNQAGELFIRNAVLENAPQGIFVGGKADLRGITLKELATECLRIASDDVSCSFVGLIETPLGLIMEPLSSAELDHATFAGCLTAIEIGSRASLSLRNCILWFNEKTLSASADSHLSTYSVCSADPLGGDTLNENPLFQGGGEERYGLKSSSPCVGKMFEAGFLGAYPPGASLPLIEEIEPQRGPLRGDIAVTIKGKGFTQSTTLLLDGIPLTTFSIINEETIRFYAPQWNSAESVEISVWNQLGASTNKVLFEYVESFMRGDANSSGVIDLSDAIFLLRYLFSLGPSPACTSLGDVNNDGKVDLADVSFLLKYLFAGGPPPQPPEADC